MLDNALHVRDGTMYFPEPLTQAAIVRRRNWFVIDVDLDGAAVGCHCPATGRIGTLVLDGLRCLLSASHNTARAPPCTVEAISVDPPGTRTPAWIGINQNAANRFVEKALTHQMLPAMVTAGTLRREQVLGGSRLDFLVNGHIYIEVKTPLDNLHVTLGGHIQTRPRQPLDSTGWRCFLDVLDRVAAGGLARSQGKDGQRGAGTSGVQRAGNHVPLARGPIPAVDTVLAWSAQRGGEVEADGRGGQLGGHEQGPGGGELPGAEGGAGVAGDPPADQGGDRAGEQQARADGGGQDGGPQPGRPGRPQRRGRRQVVHHAGQR